MDRFHNLSGDQAVQLYTPIDGIRGAEMVLNANYASQEKMNGERMILHVTDAAVTSYNRKGKLSERGLLTPQVIADANRINAEIGGGGFMLDGEIVAGRFYAFDFLEYKTTDLRAWRFDDRDRELANLCKLVKLSAIVKVKTAFTQAAKIKMLQSLKARDAEGIMFKRIDATYMNGRARDQFKHKFWETITVQVVGFNDGRRSVRIAVTGPKRALVDCGNLTIPSNRMMPTEGALIEVRYLNAGRNSGHLCQASYLRRRTDVDVADPVSELKYKAA